MPVLQVAVMYDYIDGENFSGAGFDDALRSLLAIFRLPGMWLSQTDRHCHTVCLGIASLSILTFCWPGTCPPARQAKAYPNDE